ncbi:MAG: hypothetical protein IPK02_05755 [Candidatus Accumulibacter sp.]|uniref:Uncharacterized protein n=1 Tax=Candidatus Accumulibacter affinis TaxID=2954384 RepID=A0A935T5S4_9PROT|nr:hypothetical protein [Candidatus Accumulibacter affinis]
MRHLKDQGYHYDMAAPLDWNAMRGYHLLMRTAHVFTPWHASTGLRD